MKFYVICFLLAGADAFAEDALRLPELEVRAERVRLRDDVHSTSLGSRLLQPSGHVDLAPAMARLPGVTVRTASGPGSLVRAFTAQSLGAGDTGVAIEELPLINPLGTGINLSLLPGPLVEEMEARGAFSSAFLSGQDPRPAPGGRINYRLLSPPKEGESPLKATALYGEPRLGQGAAAYRSSFVTAGATVFTTDGRFRYEDPRTHEAARRAHNDATGYGATARVRSEAGPWRLGALAVASHLDHTVSGSLTAPTRDHEKDDFQMFGADALGPRAFGRVALSHSRTGTRSDPAAFPNTTDDRAYTAFVQGGVTLLKHSSADVDFTMDNEHTRLRGNNGRFFRNIVGLTARGQIRPVPALPLTIAPVVRQDIASQFSGARDYRLAAQWEPLPAWEVSAGFAYDHAYPSITAHSGYGSAFGLVRGNPSLGVERHRLWTLGSSFTRTDGRVALTGFHDRISNRSAYEFYSDGTAQFVAVPQVTVQGVVLDVAATPAPWFSARSAVTIQQAVDARTGLEFPYKPRLQALGTIGVKPHQRVLLSLEQSYVGARRYSGTSAANRGDEWLNHWFPTAVRGDWQFRPGWVVFARVENLLERAGWDFPGYPLPGRQFYLGISTGEKPL